MSLGTPSSRAEEHAHVVDGLPAHTVVFVDVPDLPKLTKEVSKTAFGRILTSPNVAPLGRAALESLEARYFSVYRGVLGIPKWRIVAGCRGYRYIITSPAVGRFAQLSIFETESADSARSLLERIADDHRAGGGDVSTKAVDGIGFTFLKTTGRRPDGFAAGPDRFAVVAGKSVLLASDLDLALRQLPGVSQPDDGENAPRDNLEWKHWLKRARTQGASPPAATAFVDARAIFDRQPMIGYAAKMLLGPDYDGWRLLFGAISFPSQPFSFSLRARMQRASNQRGMFGPIAWGDGEMRPPNWVPATVSSSLVLRLDPRGTWRRIAEHYDRAAGEGSFQAGPARLLAKWLGGSDDDLLAKNITGRVTIVRWFDSPAQLNSKSMLVGVELKKPDHIRRILSQMSIRDGQTIDVKRFRSTQYFVFRKPFRVDLDDRGLLKIIEWDAAPTPIMRAPSNCLAILGADLVYSDNVHALQEAIRVLQQDSERLSESLPYRLVATHLSRVARGRVVGLGYSDPSESWHNLFALLSRPETLKAIKQYRNYVVDTSKLVTALENRKEIVFHDVAKHLAPYGSVVSLSNDDVEWVLVALSRDGAAAK